MASPLVFGLMCAEVADESYPGMETPMRSCAHVEREGLGSAQGSGYARPMLSLISNVSCLLSYLGQGSQEPCCAMLRDQ